jgi:hypothetical protein
VRERWSKGPSCPPSPLDPLERVELGERLPPVANEPSMLMEKDKPAMAVELALDPRP